MQDFIVDSGSDGKNLVRVILTRYPHLKMGQAYKALRKKDVRVNGVRCKTDQPVFSGDRVTLYLPDDVLSGSVAKDAGWEVASPPYQILYADTKLLVVNKSTGVTVHQAGGRRKQEPFLIDLLRRDLEDEQLELCHRLDRQTGGLLLVARQANIVQAVLWLMRQGLLLRRYRCLVRGTPIPGETVRSADDELFREVTAWLEKDPSRGNVYIHDEKQDGDLPIITRYRVLRTFPAGDSMQGEIAELEVELVTGRTHQIRAHLAHLGHPLLGDGKYGRNHYNRLFKGKEGALKGQQLFATQLIFLPTVKGPLAYLAGRTFDIEPDYDWIGSDQ